MGHFWAQNNPFVLNNFFWRKSLLLLSSACWPFLLCKIYKKLLQPIQNCDDAPFWAQNGPIASNFFFFFFFFFWKLLISFSSNYHISLLLCKILKKTFQQIQSYKAVQFLGIKWLICQNENFSENLLMNLAPFIHAYLHAKNQSEILIY